MKKPIENPWWKQFWWEWIRSVPGPEYQNSWPIAWCFYQSGRVAGQQDQQTAHLVLADFMARSNRPSLEPNQN